MWKQGPMTAFRYILCFLFILVGGASYAEDIYLASAAAGAENGTSCVNAKAYTFFNNAANWGGGAGEIDPGDTVHICGTITGAANSTLFTFQASGTSGNVITLEFESSAILQAPYFSSNGAININAKDYVKITGQGTSDLGVIKNTANGYGDTYQASSYGIDSGGGTDIEIAYLRIADIYINSSAATDSDGWSTANILIDDPSGNWSNILIHDCTLDSAHAGVWANFEGITASNLQIYNNSISDHAWGICVGAGVSSSIITDVLIHDNEITDWDNWYDPYHTDGLIIYSNTGATSSYSGKFYNNYVHGDLLDFSPSGYIGAGCGGDNFLIYNNLFVCESPSSGDACQVVYNAGPTDCTAGQPENTTFYNNTAIGVAIGTGNSWAGKAIRNARTGMSMTIKNNIFVDYHHPFEDVSSSYPGFSGDGTTDHNLFYGHTYVVAVDPSYHKTFAEWQAGPYSQEANGVEGDPSLDANYKPDAANDPVVGAGADLSATFTTDKDGNTRSGTWDIGAYEYEAAAPANTIQGMQISWNRTDGLR